MTVKISNLPAATSVGSGDVIPVVQSGTTKKIDLNSPWNINIDGGNIDGTPIGVSSASSGAFTTLTASGDVNFDSGTLFVDASTNNVGIGTTSPVVALGTGLNVSGSFGVARLTWTDTGNTGFLEFCENSTQKAFIQYRGSTDASGEKFEMRTNGNFPIDFLTGGNEAMRITSSGNVGIGTTSPAELLHVSKTQAGTTALKIENASSDGASTATLEIESNNNSPLWLQQYIDGSARLRNFANAPVSIFTNNTERMRIDSSGRVGIGTTSPSVELDIQRPFTPAIIMQDNRTGGNAPVKLRGARGSASGGDTKSDLIIDTSDNSNPSGREVARFKWFGDLHMSGGGNILLNAGAGIDFSATANGSGTTTSELLDDYEEGTWNPSVGGTATYATQQGRYTKIGRIVVAEFDITIGSIGTGNTGAITNLPFVSATAPGGLAIIGVYQNLATSLTFLNARVDGTFTNVVFQLSPSTSTSFGSSAVLTTGSRIGGTAIYAV